MTDLYTFGATFRGTTVKITRILLRSLLCVDYEKQDLKSDRHTQKIWYTFENFLIACVDLFATCLLLFHPSISFPAHLIKIPTPHFILTPLYFTLDISGIPFLFHPALTRVFSVTPLRIKCKRATCFWNIWLDVAYISSITIMINCSWSFYRFIPLFSYFRCSVVNIGHFTTLGCEINSPHSIYIPHSPCTSYCNTSPNSSNIDFLVLEDQTHANTHKSNFRNKSAQCHFRK